MEQFRGTATPGGLRSSVVITAWEKDLDHTKAKEILYGKFKVDVTTG